MKIKLDEIITDESLQLRVETSSTTVAEYEERMTEGEQFPAILVWLTIEGQHILLDGWHRFTAMKNIGAVDAECKLFKGSRLEALVASAIGNRNHGRPLDRADKRKAIARLVEASGELSSNQIADAIGCSNHTVDAVRKELGNCQPATRKGKDGKHYPATMKREPRTDDAESDRDDEKTEPPPDPGIGGAGLSPQEISKTDKKRGKGVELANDAIAILQKIPFDDPLRVMGMETVMSWIKANK